MYARQDDRSGLYGYWRHGRWAVRPQFRYAHRFVSGYAAVNLNDGRPGLLGLDGRLLALDAICGGRTPVVDEDDSFTGFGGYDSQTPRYAAIRTVKGGRHEWGSSIRTCPIARFPTTSSRRRPSR